MAKGMEIKGEVNKRKGDNRNLSDKNYAFGHYVNDACLKKGEELVKDVIKSREKQAESVKKDIEHRCKDAAEHLGGIARGRQRYGGGRSYSCFECEHRGKGLKDKYGSALCGFKCNNGQYFKQKEKGGEDVNQERIKGSNTNQVEQQGSVAQA